MGQSLDKKATLQAFHWKCRGKGLSRAARPLPSRPRPEGADRTPERSWRPGFNIVILDSYDISGDTRAAFGHFHHEPGLK